MKFKLKALVAAAIMAASVPALAAMDGATSGNGSLLANFRSYVGNNDSGGDDMSALFDLGVGMNDVLSWNGMSGFTQTWNLTAANYGTAWNDLLGFSVNDAAIEFNVIALDSTGETAAAGGSRYLTTYDAASFVGLSNANLIGFNLMDQYVTANNSRGTHATETNGASTALSGGSPNTHFGSVNGTGDGDTWVSKTTADTTKNLATAQNFWSLTTTAPGGTGAASKTAFGYDLDGNGSIGAGEFGEWSVNAAAGTLTYANPMAAPVPEADTWAMMLAGLGLVGFMARRRMAV